MFVCKVLYSAYFLSVVLSFIGDLRFNVRIEHVPGCRVGGRDRGGWWLPAGGIRASEGTFSSYNTILDIIGSDYDHFHGSALLHNTLLLFRDSGDPYSDSRGRRDGYPPRGRGRGRGRGRRYDDRYGHGRYC